MKLQKLMSYMRRAIDDYNMIEEGDHIAVGISGGKDSLTLLYGLNGLKRFYPKKFDITAITVDLGFENFDTKPISKLCKDLCVNYIVAETDIANIVFKERKESNPCSLCSKMRKGALNDAIKAQGCNKVAYGHHLDDVVETLMMSLIYEGRIHTFSPVTYLDRMDLTVIRPMIYVNEADVNGFKNLYKLPVAEKSCPNDGYSKREYIKELVAKINHENPGVKNRMFTAISSGKIKGWEK